MQVRDGFLLREVGGTFVVVPLGERVVDFNGLITLNATGRVLWERLGESCEQNDLVEALVEAFEVTPEEAERDAQAFIDDLDDKNLLLERAV